VPDSIITVKKQENEEGYLTIKINKYLQGAYLQLGYINNHRLKLSNYSLQ